MKKKHQNRSNFTQTQLKILKTCEKLKLDESIHSRQIFFYKIRINFAVYKQNQQQI
jgi:hypothetical protein